MSVGSFVFVLHGHLPYCRKAGVWPFGEEWVFEAMAETYIPLLDAITDLVERGVPVRLTMGFTPVLVEQLHDPYMLFRFDEYLSAKVAAAEADMARFGAQSEGRLQDLARVHRDRYEKVKASFRNRYDRDIVGAFHVLQEQGHVQVLAGAATHAYLPLLSRKSSVYAQVRVGCDAYRQCFGANPTGIWLPECGYRPGLGNLERVLADLGIAHFFVDAHAIQGGAPVGTYRSKLAHERATAHAAPRPGYTTYLPYRLRGSDISVLGRNERVALQVWSSEWGYPGDGNYREFHKRDSVSGLHYWKVTSRLVDLASKEIYEPEAALARAREHAEHFVGLVERLLGDFQRETGKSGVIIAPFDVELFGHWWLEGLDWLRWVLEGLARSPNVDLTTAARYLEQYPPACSIDLVESSWGLGGAHYIWDNEATGWMWDQIHSTEAEMERAVREASRMADAMRKPTAADRLIRQAAREALLLQGSDWPFLVTTEQAADYASRRFLEHRHRFTGLVEAFKRQSIPPEVMRDLEEIEAIDAVFPDLDESVFAEKQGFSTRR